MLGVQKLAFKRYSLFAPAIYLVADQRVAQKSKVNPDLVSSPRLGAKCYGRKTVETFGHVDILVYNSGVLWVAKVAETSDEIWEKTLDANLLGAARTAREVLKRGRMLERKQGRIIFISSEAGKIGELGLM